MAAPKSVWGIDIGQCALRALKLREIEGQLQVEAFDIIEHSKILSEPDANRDVLVRETLERFLSRYDVSDSRLSVSVPGQASFTRFVKMPPVEPKQVPDLVRYEAKQQIPFDIDEVIWRWQSFLSPDSPEIEVGLFAIKREDVLTTLAPFTEMLVGVDVIQMAPLALYNFMNYDQQVATDGATLLVDIGADTTDLVVADGPRMWTRTIQLGGNRFTQALAKSFKLSFAKAERLKRTAATSKYARQVFQAMRPVFFDLVQEIQRSIGYYTNLHREARFTRLLGLGNGFRLPGLQKFLAQNLSTEVIRIDAFNALQPSPMISAPEFTESVLGFAVAYGLALQGLELTDISTNLLPDRIASQRRWTKKRPWFVAAAALLAAASIGLAGRALKDNSVLKREPEDLSKAKKVVAQYGQLKRQYDKLKNQGTKEQTQAAKLLKVQGYRSFWPHLLQVVSESVQKAAPHQQLMVHAKADELKTIEADQRQCLFVMSLDTAYIPDLSVPGAKDLLAGATRTKRDKAAPGGMTMAPGMLPGMPGGGMPPGVMPGFAPPSGARKSKKQKGGTSAKAERGFRITLKACCPLPDDSILTMAGKLRDVSKVAAERFKGELEIVDAGFAGWIDDGTARSARGGSTRGGAAFGGPLPPGVVTSGMPGTAGGLPSGGAFKSLQGREGGGLKDITGRSMADDKRFSFVWIVKITGDGLPAEEGPAG